MKFVKNGVIISMVILFIILISGCSEDGSGTTYILDGTWNLSTSNGIPGDIGSGSFTQTFFGTMDFGFGPYDIYIGSGSLSGGPYPGSYDVGGSENNGTVIFSFTDGDDESLDFEGTISGNTVTGTYSGWSGEKWEFYSGDFTATKQ